MQLLVCKHPNVTISIISTLLIDNRRSTTIVIFCLFDISCGLYSISCVWYVLFGVRYILANLHCESKKNCATFIFTVTLANVGRFLADRTNGHAIATLLRLSSSVCL